MRQLRAHAPRRAAAGLGPVPSPRASPLFARVAEQRSDTRQLSAALAPTAFNPAFNWSLAYVYTGVGEQTRGFASTAGDPRAVDWALGAFDTRHQVRYPLSYNAFDAVTLRWFGNLRSGLPFTPQVNADVNGDGYANDRAFTRRIGPRRTAAQLGRRRLQPRRRGLPRRARVGELHLERARVR